MAKSKKKQLHKTARIETDRFCICKHVEPVLTKANVEAKPRTFKYQLVYGNYPGFAFKGFNNAQTVDMIRKAMVELSAQSGAKFVESTSKPHVRFYFMKTVTYNAIGVYMGDGKIYLSQTRPVTAAVVNCCVQHEVGHYLNIKASPAADKWGHCPDIACIMNINGTAKKWCARCKGQLISRYGR